MANSQSVIPELEGIPLFLSVKDVAGLLGVDTQTIYGLVNANVLKHHRVTENIIRIPRSAIEELLGAKERSNGHK